MENVLRSTATKRKSGSKPRQDDWPTEIIDRDQKYDLLLERIHAVLARQGDELYCKCSKCTPPLPGIRELDSFTGKLIKAKKLKHGDSTKGKFCPYYVIDRALFDSGLYDRRADELSAGERHRDAHRDLKTAVKRAAAAINKGVRLANRTRWPHALERFESGELPTQRDYYYGADKRLFLEVLSLRERLDSLVQEIRAETRRRSGPSGVTKRQSLVEGFLEAWRDLNGELPSHGNKDFADHLNGALAFIYGPEFPEVSEKNIRDARDRLMKQSR